MKLSIIIPYYNSGQYIGETLDSLLDQDLGAGECEIIVVDDGSKEEPVILKRYLAEYPQIVYVRQENGGSSAARNHGLEIARGEWVYFCDADDQVQPQVLGRLLDIGNERSCDIIFANSSMVPDDEPMPTAPKRDFDAVTPVMTGPEYITTLTDFFNFGVWQYLMSRSWLLDSGIRFPEGIPFVEDRFFFLDAAMNARRVVHADLDLYYYIQRQSSLIHDQRKIRYDACSGYFLQFFEKLTGLMNDPAVPEPTKSRLASWRNFDGYEVLFNVLRYLPVSWTPVTYDRLSAMGAIPFSKAGTWRKHIVTWCMNHKHLWLFICRLYHLVPRKIRLKY